MRLSTALVALPVIALTAVPMVVAAETTRTLRAELSPDALGHFVVENLAGTMRVVPGSGPSVVAVATIHAEDDDLAKAMKVEQVAGKLGVPTLRVIYPLDRGNTIRYPGRGSDAGILGKLFGDFNSSMEYDGQRVKVSGNHGVLLYADVEVQVPRHLENATFRNLVGLLEGHDVEGKILFDSSSGDVSVSKVRGEIKANTGSGDVTARALEGSFVCDTGSGNCDLGEFKGDSLRCDVGSGNVRIHTATAKLVVADTGSGNVDVSGGDIEEFRADTGSGNVRLENKGARLARVKADTGSGNVTLRLAPDAAFEALADQGSGDISMGYRDAEAIVKHKEVIGYRRGDARIKIDVDTGSGDLTIEPGA